MLLAPRERLRFEGLSATRWDVAILEKYLGLLRAGYSVDEVRRISAIRVNAATKLKRLELAARMVSEERGVALIDGEGI